MADPSCPPPLPPLSVLIVDDEPLARDRMAALCAALPAIRIAGSAPDGERALDRIAALAPDIVLLDIAMPGLDGLGVAAALGRLPAPPAILFCTAHPHHAVAAFDLGAVDYLLKPVSADRLARAIARVRASRNAVRPVTAIAEEFWVPVRQDMVRISAAEIDRIEAERDYMRLHVGTRSYLLHDTIAALERRLDPARFLRVHRSTILRRDRIAGLRHDGAGGCHADLLDGSSVRVGRTYLGAVRALVGR